MQRRSYFGYGVPCNPMDPVDPKGKRPKIQVFKLLLALSVASASMNDARKRFRQFRAVSQLVGRIFCCRKRRNWKTGSANTHKLNHKPCFCVGLLYIGEEKRGRCEKDIVLNHQRYITIDWAAWIFGDEAFWWKPMNLSRLQQQLSPLLPKS